MSISSSSEGKVLGRCLLAWPCVLRGSRSPLEPLDHFCKGWWQHGQTSLSEAAGTSEARLTGFPGDVNANAPKCGPGKGRGSGRARELSLDITPREYSSKTGKRCYRKTAGMHDGQAWSRGTQKTMPAADTGSCLRDCPAPCIPLPQRYLRCERIQTVQLLRVLSPLLVFPMPISI